MATSPHSKRHSLAVDVESGDRIDQQDSLRAPGEQSSESATPDSRRSAENEDGHHRARWYDSPHWKRIHDRIPSPITRQARKVVLWIKGPKPPKEYHINPFFERVQTFPIRLLARLPRAARILIFICSFTLWLVIFGVIISKFGLPQDIGGFGAPVRLACITRLWYVFI